VSAWEVDLVPRSLDDLRCGGDEHGGHGGEGDVRFHADLLCVCGGVAPVGVGKAAAVPKVKPRKTLNDERVRAARWFQRETGGSR